MFKHFTTEPHPGQVHIEFMTIEPLKKNFFYSEILLMKARWIFCRVGPEHSAPVGFKTIRENISFCQMETIVLVTFKLYNI